MLNEETKIDQLVEILNKVCDRYWDGGINKEVFDMINKELDHFFES